MSSDSQTFPVARTKCREMGGILAMPKSAALQDAMVSIIIIMRDYWIGLERFITPSNEYILVWEDGTQLDIGNDYDNICSCEYREIGDYCAAVRVSYIVFPAWGDLSCTNFRTYICEIAECEFPSIPNVVEEWGGKLAGASITYTCLPGYKVVSGDTTRTCLFNGTWSGSPPVCGYGGSWLAWGAWGDCSVLCGTGTISRNRTCHDPNVPSEQALCTGGATNSTQTATCLDQICPHCNTMNCLGLCIVRDLHSYCVCPHSVEDKVGTVEHSALYIIQRCTGQCKLSYPGAKVSILNCPVVSLGVLVNVSCLTLEPRCPYLIVQLFL
ncbi:SCO-spondin [Lingula anatina]|uniref:SCO-spondin n=1 Tax=Lingula anatina TaxID=7574 RepID=A0A1S3IB25_LINAN|nr:SCO-spondin [Lingula anatina]|eukprot:XP_013394604.1 SCO-spondin [Lingula anatina]